MRVSEIGRLCLFGRREWKTGCGQDVVVVVKTNEERRMPLHVCVRSRKNIIANRESGLRFKTQRQENRLHVFHFVILTIKREE